MLTVQQTIVSNRSKGLVRGEIQIHLRLASGTAPLIYRSKLPCHGAAGFSSNIKEIL
jgi:hypothetical protein